MAEIGSTSSPSTSETERVDIQGLFRGRGRGGRGRGRRGRERVVVGERRQDAGRRGRGRGRGRGGRADVERVQEQIETKTNRVKEVIEDMEREKMKGIMLKLVDREPGLLFDILLEDDSDPPIQPDPTTSSMLDWCRCGNCLQMPTELERKSCGLLPRNCASEQEQMQEICLNPRVLAIGQRYHQEMLGRHGQRMEDYNATMRLAAYRNFILWRHGRLGAGNRRVIRSCCVLRIRRVFPNSLGQYTGFLPNRFI